MVHIDITSLARRAVAYICMICERHCWESRGVAPTPSVQAVDMNLQNSRDALVSMNHNSCRFRSRLREFVVCFCVTFIVPAAITGK